MAHTPLLKQIKDFLWEKEQKETTYTSHPTPIHLAPHQQKYIPQNRNIIIVGGGLAGLTCAYHLKKYGIRATIYEANSRLGGRCWTKRDGFNDNQFIERGGELIDSNHKAIMELAHELDLALDDLLQSQKQNTKPSFFINNAELSLDEANNNFLEIRRKIKRDFELAGFSILYSHHTEYSRYLDQMSIVDWINLNVSGPIY